MSHNSLEQYYKTLFTFKQFHNYSFEDMENLIPYERDVYMHLLNEHLKKVAK